MKMKNKTLGEIETKFVELKTMPDLSITNHRQKSLSSCVSLLTSMSRCDFLSYVSFEEELYDKLTFDLIVKLAKAVDTNNVIKIRQLKVQYGNTKEFANAKDFLNDKCKKVWNVLDSKNIQLKVPHDAMKTLGISNQPTLDFLLKNSIEFLEKDSASTTVKIINSILENKNIKYDIEDTYSYLKTMYKQKSYKYNLITLTYMLKKLGYDKSKIIELGANKQLLKNAFKRLNFVEKVKYIYVNYLKNYMFI